MRGKRRLGWDQSLSPNNPFNNENLTMNGESHNLILLSTRWLIGCCLLTSCLTSIGEEPSWAMLTGRVLIEGPTPEAKPFDLGRDSCCIDAKPTDQRWLIGPEGGLANVVISLKASARTKVPLPTGDSISNKPIVLTNTGCSFSPRIVLLRSGQTLRIVNDDPTTHNVAATLGRNASFNLVLPPKDHRDLPMEFPERKPLPIACNIHPYMRGYVSVRSDPYIAITDSDGKFTIDPVPSGNWEFQFWHEGRYLPTAKFEFNGKPLQSDTRGRVRLEIQAGKANSLGSIRLRIDNTVEH